MGALNAPPPLPTLFIYSGTLVATELTTEAAPSLSSDSAMETTLPFLPKFLLGDGVRPLARSAEAANCATLPLDGEALSPLPS